MKIERSELTLLITITNKVLKILKKSEQVVLHKLDLYFKKQDKRIKELAEGLKDIEENICLYKSKLQEFQNSKDEDLVFSMNSIENIVTKPINIIPKIAIPDIKIKYSYDDNDLTKIDQFLNTMHQISIDPVDPEEAK